jgi:hypothetical protein
MSIDFEQSPHYYDGDSFESDLVVIKFEIKRDLPEPTFDEVCFNYEDYIYNVLPYESENSIKSIDSWVRITRVPDRLIITLDKKNYLTRKNLSNCNLINNYINYLKILQVIPTITSNIDTDVASIPNHSIRYEVNISVDKNSNYLNKVFVPKEFRHNPPEYTLSAYKYQNTHYLEKIFTFNIANLSEKNLDNFIRRDLLGECNPNTVLEPEIFLEFNNDRVSIYELYNLDKIIEDNH